MADLGSLVVSLEANTARFEADLNRAEASVRNIMGRIEQVSGAAATAITGMAAGMAAAWGVNAFKDGIEGAIKSAGAMKDMSERAGVSAESLSKLMGVAKLSGTSIDDVTGGLQKLSKNMEAAAGGSAKQEGAFKTLSISTTDSSGKLRDAGDVMVELAKKLDGMDSGTQRVAIAQLLLGKSGANLLPVIHDLANAGALNARVTNDMAAMADMYEKNLIRLDSRKQQLYNTIAKAVIPTMLDFTDTLLKADSVVGRLNKSANDLSNDNSLQNWARDAAMGAAFVVDVFDSLNRVLQIVGKAIGAAIADITSFFGAFSGLGVAFKNGGWDAVKKQVTDGFAEMKSHGEEFAKDMDEILGKAFLRDKLGAEFAKRDAGLKPLEKSRQTTHYDIPDLSGNAKQSQYDTFLDELLRQITKAGMGQIEELRVKALQLAGKEGRNPQSAFLLIDQYKAAQESLFLKDYTISLDKLISQSQAKFELIGKTAHEQELLNIASTQQIDLENRIAMKEKELGPLSADTRAKMVEASSAATEKMVADAEKRYTAERKWETGAMLAFKNYAEAASNAAAQANNLFTNAFKGMEDALVNFVRTGKLDFKSLADSIINDLIRIQIQQSITGPLAAAMQASGGFGGLLGSIFGGGGGLPNGGGMANMNPNTPIMVAASAAGGYDIPAGVNPLTQLHQSEMVLPAEQANVIRDLARGNGSTPNVVVQINNQSGQNVNARQQSGPQFNGKDWVLGVVLEAADSNPHFRNAMGMAR